MLDDADETVRGWAVRLLVEDKKPSDAVTTKLADMAHKDKSASVRLALASAMQRMPADAAWASREGLAAHEEDAKDANLPLMIWYGVEPLVPANPDRAAELLTKCGIPLVREYIARRIAAEADAPAAPPPHTLKPLVQILLTTDDAGVQRDVLQGMIEALQGRRLRRPRRLGAGGNASSGDERQSRGPRKGASAVGNVRRPGGDGGPAKDGGRPGTAGCVAAHRPANAGGGEGAPACRRCCATCWPIAPCAAPPSAPWPPLTTRKRRH